MRHSRPTCRGRSRSSSAAMGSCPNPAQHSMAWRGEQRDEHRRSWSGQAVLVRWGEADRDAELLTDDARFDGVYRGQRDGVVCWFCLHDHLTSHPSAEHAIRVAFAKQFGTPQTPSYLA